MIQVNPGTCSTCKHWKRLPDYADWAGGTFVYLKKQGACDDENCPVRGVEVLEDFGCVHWEPWPYTVEVASTREVPNGTGDL
jgi:hypothetical protein